MNAITRSERGSSCLQATPIGRPNENLILSRAVQTLSISRHDNDFEDHQRHSDIFKKRLPSNFRSVD